MTVSAKLSTMLATLAGARTLAMWPCRLRMLHHTYAVAVACHPAGSPACQNAVGAFNGMYGILANGTLLQAVPAVIGAFIGAPLLARELETGTFRYAWTQGFGRRRWALAKLVPLAVVLTAAAWAFSLLLSWYYQPYFATGNHARGLSEMSPFNSGMFDLRGAGFAAWTLAAFAIGALAGMLVRRVVPAIAAALVLYAGLAFAAGALLREHYLTPLVTTSLNLPGSAWILGQWWTRGGVTLSQSAMYQPINAAFQRLTPVMDSRPQKAQAYLAALRYLTHHGYRYWTRYQPGSRFWPFQWIESGWLLALSVLLIGATIWLVRRRAT